MADSVETLGVELRTRVKRTGAKRKSKKKKVQGETFAHHGVKKLLRMGLQCELPNRKVKHEGTDGSSSSRQEESTSLSFFMVVYGLEVDEELSTMATQAWAEGVWSVKWPTGQKEAW